MIITDEYLTTAQAAIEQVFRANREKLMLASGSIAIELKEDQSPVTELDRQLEAELKAVLQGLDATIGIEGEESGIEGSREAFWLIDPIDGTDAFTRGMPVYRNMVALINEGEPIFTVVYQPFFDNMYIATKGKGAFKNGQRITIQPRPLERSRIEFTTPRKDAGTWALMTELAQHFHAVRIIGDFLPSVEGALDGLILYKNTGGPWDFAPRALLMSEAGARVANIGSDTYDYTVGNMLAIHPDLFDQVMKIITDTIAHEN